MAEIHGRPTVTMSITLTLTEEEARALEAIAGYDEKHVAAAFYTHVGAAYLQKHEAGFFSLMRSVRKQLPLWLKRANVARRAFTLGESTGGEGDA